MFICSAMLSILAYTQNVVVKCINQLLLLPYLLSVSCKPNSLILGPNMSIIFSHFLFAHSFYSPHSYFLLSKSYPLVPNITFCEDCLRTSCQKRFLAKVLGHWLVGHRHAMGKEKSWSDPT